jgi:hypothetical protein
MEAQASQISAHHFWAFFGGPRHKFCAAALPKGYRVRKGVLNPETQVLVACYFLQPYFIDLAIWIRHFPKFATFFNGPRDLSFSTLTL